MGWLKRKFDGLENAIFKLNPVWVVVVGVLLVFALFAVVLQVIMSVTNAYYAYIVMAGLTLFLFITRTIEPWEWGIEAYHLVNFSVAFVFGPFAALAMNFISFLFFPITQAMGRSWLHYMTKTLIGPAIQAVVLAAAAVFAGLLGMYARESVLQNLVFYYMLIVFICDTLLGSVLRRTLTPLTGTRLMIYTGIDLTFNYFLISNFGLGFIGFLEGLR